MALHPEFPRSPYAPLVPSQRRFPADETLRQSFENEWQSFRTRQTRELDLQPAKHTYETPGRYTIAVKVIDIFGNDTMTLVPVAVG